MTMVATFIVLAVCTYMCASLPINNSEWDLFSTIILYRISDKPDPLIIKCDARAAKSGGKYSWQKNNLPLTGKHVEDDGTIVIPNPDKYDEGQYKCFVESDLGVSSSRIKHVRYTYFDVPKVTPQKQKPIEGRTFSLACEAPDAYPLPKISWTFQPAGSAESKEVQDKRITQNTDGNLYFSNATKEDVGKYVCLGKSPAVDQAVVLAEYEVEALAVDKSPKDNEVVQQYVSPDTEIVAGTSVYLYCIYGGNPLAHPDWFKDGKDSNNSPDDRVTRYNKSVGKRLLIKDVKLQDEGTYTCSIDNEVGKVQKHTFHVTVVDPPTVNIGAEQQVTKEGEDVTIKCEITGKPAPKIFWTHNSKPLTQKDGAHIDESIQGVKIISSLTVKKAKKSDAGYYGCWAPNEQGDDYKETLLTVS